jgi:tRNA threonylcarbamoyladenosine biosynthesis protein TsaE
MHTPAQISAFDLSVPQTLLLPDEAATAQLGALIAPHLKAGDVIYLHGDLGMGKSALARGLIRILTNPHQDVPSPTFTLVQSYATPAFELLHLDLYRLKSPQEVHELGLDEALGHAVLVIEWPDRLAHLGFDDRLDIRLERTETTGRLATLNPVGRFGTQHTHG